MNRIMLLTAVAISFLVSGCNESQTVKQLKLEKAQIVSEFNQTKANMQEQIDSQTAKIAELEAKIAEMTNTVEGYNNILFDVIPKNEELKKQIADLTKQYEQLQKSLNSSGENAKKAQEAIEKLKNLQQKAIEQRQE